MKCRKYMLLVALLMLTSCSTKTLVVTVTSPRGFATDYEIVEMDKAPVIHRFKNKPFVITDGYGEEVPYQLTHDGKLVFPVSVDAKSTSRYKISKGTPAQTATISTGRFHPERHDDMAWENDLIGYRAYGPESQRLGDRLYGYDIFLKRDTSEPILERLYALNEDPALCARIDSLRKAGNRQEANRLEQEKSYHIDHGNGMDCYAVGPTLGAATSALIHNDTIAYPLCFESYEVLDNGPLRFTVVLRYPPQHIAEKDVMEHRVITLDAGTHLNRTTVTYEGLEGGGDVRPQVITGIVIHQGSEQMACFAPDRYIAYSDPTQGSDNGEIYIGAVFLDEPHYAGVTEHGGVRHVAAISSLDDNASYTYLWGAGWNRSDIPTWPAWLQCLARSKQKIDLPLEIKMK